MKSMIKVPVFEIVKKISDAQGGKLLVLDGIITQRLVEAANKAGIQYIIGHRTSNLKKTYCKHADTNFFRYWFS